MLRLWLFVGLFCGIAGNATAQLAISEQDPRHLRFGSDPDQFLVRPGNDGVVWFKDRETSHPSNIEAWQDEYCDSQWLAVDQPDYDYHPADADTSKTQAYWMRMDHWVHSVTVQGKLPIWIINDYVLDRDRQQPWLLDDLTSHARNYPMRDLVIPAILLEVDSWSQDHEERRQAIARGLEGQPVGVRITRLNYNSIPTRGWGFLVADEEIIPETYRGQAAASWLHQRYGQMPVFISPESPDFLRDTIWLTTGISGVFYRPLKPAGSEANNTQFIHLRASSVYLDRFSGLMSLSPRPLARTALFSLLDPENAMSNIFPSSSTGAAIELPSWLPGQVVGRSWYNPATDENIVRPLTTAPEVLKISPPGKALWVHNVVRSTYAADNDTTVSAITPLDL